MIDQDPYDVNWPDLWVWCCRHGKKKEFMEKLNKYMTMEKKLYDRELDAYIKVALAEIKSEDMKKRAQVLPRPTHEVFCENDEKL